MHHIFLDSRLDQLWTLDRMSTCVDRQRYEVRVFQLCRISVCFCRPKLGEWDRTRGIWI